MLIRETDWPVLSKSRMLANVGLSVVRESQLFTMLPNAECIAKFDGGPEFSEHLTASQPSHGWMFISARFFVSLTGYLCTA